MLPKTTPIAGALRPLLGRLPRKGRAEGAELQSRKLKHSPKGRCARTLARQRRAGVTSFGRGGGGAG